MGYLETVRSINWQFIFYVVIGVIPYVDLETIGAVPGLRAIIPFVDPIYWLQLTWTERARLIALIIVPYVDGEWIKLATGRDVNEVISDT